MKKLILSLALVLIAGGFAIEAYAQPSVANLGPEWGETDEIKVRMSRAYTLLNENVRNKQYGRAAAYLNDLLTNAPKAHVNIYVYGTNMYRARAEAAEDKAEKMVMLDSLALLYDMGIANFGEQEPALKKRFIENKAIDYLNNVPLDRMGIADRFRAAIAELGNDIDPKLILVYFNELSVDYQNDDVSTEEFLSEYNRLYPMVATLGTETQMRQWDGILTNSGAANCENLEKIFSDRIAAEPENEELLGMVLALLERAGCLGSDFYLKTGEFYYKVKPSAQTALILASYYAEKGDKAAALRYYTDALNLATDPTDRSKVSIQIAASYLSDGNNREAYNYATRAAQADPNNPTSYYIMGMAQASAARTVENDFERQAVYWLVVDNLLRARQLAMANPSYGLSISNLNKGIAEFQTGFPTLEDIFMSKGLEEGASYTVNAGWITGTTTVRKRP